LELLPTTKKMSNTKIIKKVFSIRLRENVITEPIALKKRRRAPRGLCWG